MKRASCPKCKETMVRKTGQWGAYFACPNYPARCDILQSISTDGRIGKPSDKSTREARKELHKLFDRLWQRGHSSRRGAYRWLGQVMGLKVHECHIMYFELEQCERATNLIQETFSRHMWEEVVVVKEDGKSYPGECGEYYE